MKRRFFLQTSLATVAGTALPVRILAAADAPPAATTTPTPTPPTPAASATMDAALTRLYELGRRNVAIHDPSAIIKCKDEYWVFYTGNGVPSYRSKDLVNWIPGPATLPGPFPWFADAVPQFRGLNCWAPDCNKIGDRYFLFYAISAFGKNTSAIGLVTNPTLDPADPAYLWSDQGLVIKSIASDHYNCIDPCAITDADGKLWLSFGSFWSGIKLIALDPTGHPLPDAPLTAIAANPRHATGTTEGALGDSINKSQIEASYVYAHDKYYYLFVNWGLCCKGLSSTYNIRLGRSEKITGPYLDKDGVDLAHDGGTLFAADDGPLVDTVQPAQGNRGGPPPPAHVHALIGPGQAGIFQENGKFWFSCHYYDGTTPTGASLLSIRPLTWDKDGWPVLGEYPAPAPIPTTPFRQGRGRRGGPGNNPPAPVPAAPAPTPATPATTPAPST